MQIDIDPEPAVFTIDDALDGRASCGARTTSSRRTSSRAATSTRRCRGRHRRRGRIRNRRAGTALHRAERHGGDGERRRWRHGLGIDAVPVLHPQGPERALQPAGRKGPRRADGDRRRLWRQGRVPVDHRLPRGAAGVEVRKAREARLRPRRGYGGDDQAPSVANAAPHGGRRATDACWRWTSTSSSTAARTARCRQSCCLAERFIPPGPTSARTFGCAAAPWRPTRRRTGRFAALARRKVSSRSNVTWIALPRLSGLPPDELRRRNFIARRPDERGWSGDARPDRHGGAARSRAVDLPAITPSARASTPSIRRCACARGSGSRRSCMAPVSPALVKITWPRSWPSRRCADGRVRVLSSNTEIGQGTNTIFAQIAADTLGVPLETIEIAAARHRRLCPTADRQSPRARAWSSVSWSRPRRAGCG